MKLTLKAARVNKGLTQKDAAKLMGVSRKGISVRRQCKLLKINRSSLYYDTKPEDTAKAALKE